MIARTLCVCLLGAGLLMAAKPVEVMPGCTLVDHKNNDGDSFRVRRGTNEFVLRLEQVDCPETQKSMKARIKDQAKHWRTNEAGVIALGRQATEFSRTNLLAGPFTVRTRHTKVFGGPRIYGDVELSDGLDLGKALLKAGLARERAGAR